MSETVSAKRGRSPDTSILSTAVTFMVSQVRKFLSVNVGHIDRHGTSDDHDIRSCHHCGKCGFRLPCQGRASIQEPSVLGASNVGHDWIGQPLIVAEAGLADILDEGDVMCQLITYSEVSDEGNSISVDFFALVQV